MAAASGSRMRVVKGDCLQGFVHGDMLGRGEQGTAYAMSRNSTGRNISSTHVLKISEFDDDDAKNKWVSEVRISRILGTAEIGPIIHDAWICDGKGYIVMQRMVSDLRKLKNAAEKKLGEKRKIGKITYDIDHISYCPERILHEYVSLLEDMIDMGYIHFDNHPGNLGIVTKADRQQHAILFDFGFTVHRPGMTDADKMNALGFSIGQIIEHTPPEEIRGSYLYNLMISIDQGTYVWGSGNPGRTNERTFISAHPADPRRSIHAALRVPRGVMKDLYVGFQLYCSYILMGQFERYDWPDYGVIYLIRQSLPFEEVAPAAAAAAAAAPAAPAPRSARIAAAAAAAAELEAGAGSVASRLMPRGTKRGGARKTRRYGRDHPKGTRKYRR